MSGVTARARLATRIFFRHFADKREVLFLRDREFLTVASTFVASAPMGLAARRASIRSDKRPRERELLRSALLSDATEQALRDYGIDNSVAALVAPFSVRLLMPLRSDASPAATSGRIAMSLG